MKKTITKKEKDKKKKEKEPEIKKEKEKRVKEKISKKLKKTKTAKGKKIIKKKIVKKEIKKEKIKPERYFEAVGRRKTAIARVRIFTRGKKEFLINEKPYQEYFLIPELQQIAAVSLKRMKCFDRFRVTVKTRGGGLHAQAEAVRHGIARALVKFNPDFRKRLRKTGYLTRDSRARERKKFGLKRARRAPQWRKR